MHANARPDASSNQQHVLMHGSTKAISTRVLHSHLTFGSVFCFAIKTRLVLLKLALVKVPAYHKASQVLRTVHL